jgi:hypothetical protein
VLVERGDARRDESDTHGRLRARMVPSMRVVEVSLRLLGLCSVACAGTERTAVEAEAEPSAVEAEVAAPSTAAVSANAAAARDASPPLDAAPAVAEPAPYDPRWVDEVRAVVAAYDGWGRVDDEMRFAPWLCRMPQAAAARWSASEHPETHGDKLYTLYAMDPVAYGAPRSAMDEPARLPGLSQVIVKESFAPVRLDDDSQAGWGVDGGRGEHRLRPAERGGQRFVAGERQGLFVMMRVDGPAEGTDAGWVYATVKPDMTTVTAVGVIDACAGCHVEAGEGRLFGLPGVAAPPGPSPDGRKIAPHANAAPR